MDNLHYLTKKGNEVLIFGVEKNEDDEYVALCRRKGIHECVSMPFSKLKDMLTASEYKRFNSIRLPSPKKRTKWEKSRGI